MFHLTTLLENAMRIVNEELTFLSEVKGKYYKCEKCGRRVDLGLNGVLLFRWSENTVNMYCKECHDSILKELGKSILFIATG